MKPLRVKDNTSFDTSVIFNVKNLVKNIINKTLKQLESEGVFIFPSAVKNTEDLSSDQMILQFINNKIHTGNVMGFLGYGTERLIIESRFSNNKNVDYFFRYLLERVLDLPNIVDLETNASREKQLYSLLLFVFPRYLSAAIRKGLYKQYINRKCNDCNIKGIIDIPRHLNKNTPFLGKIAYTERVFSYDNLLTQLVRHTIEMIKGKPYGRNILFNVKEEVKLIINATPTYEIYDRQIVLQSNEKNPIRHAYYKEYLALQRLCLMILRYQKHEFGRGGQTIFGILFDGAWLWEEYINILVKDVFYHPMNKAKTEAQRLFNNEGKIYPDFISKSDSPRVIADAKYKPVKNIKSKDYLQLLAYMYRFDAKQGYYFYPEINNKDMLHLKLNTGSTYENNVTSREDIFVIKLGLQIPKDSDDYDMFVREIQVNEQNFINNLKATL